MQTQSSDQYLCVCHLLPHPKAHGPDPDAMQHAAALHEQGLSCTRRTGGGTLSFSPPKSLKFGVLQHVCKGKEEKGREGGRKSPNHAPCCIAWPSLGQQALHLQPFPPSHGGTGRDGTLPVPRPPSVCLPLCPFCLLAASSGRTISSKLIVTALGSALKSMVPIRAWPGRCSSRGAAAAVSCPVYFPPLERQARLQPPLLSFPTPQHRAGWPCQLHHEHSAKADPNEEVTSHL